MVTKPGNCKNISAGPRQTEDLTKAISALHDEGKTHAELTGVTGGGEHTFSEAEWQAEDTWNDRYAEWVRVGKPEHEWRPLVPGATACWRCGSPKDSAYHPVTGYAARDAEIVTLQCELLDHSGHLRPGLPPQRRTDLEARINRLRAANGWPRLDLRGR